jgi:hypothetical protein
MAIATPPDPCTVADVAAQLQALEARLEQLAEAAASDPPESVESTDRPPFIA